MTIPHTTNINPIDLLRPKRKIIGMSAILLPFKEGNRCDFNDVDWESFDQHVERTRNAGLVPAVNMDTGYANLIDEETRTEVLRRTNEIMQGEMFVAGAFVGDSPGDDFNLTAYQTAMDDIQTRHGTPILFQSYGLTKGAEERIADRYETLAKFSPKFIAFELGTMFAPFGKIYSLPTYSRLMQITECIGAKHSSLSRKLEWERLALRNSQRKEFLVLTGNDLAIDMVMYGSDYLLGLSTFAPDLFAARDVCWEMGDSRFYELNDQLQYLGFFAFRNPVPAYKHTAAQFLKLRGWIKTDRTHNNSPTRLKTDIEILKELAKKWEVLD